MGVQKAKTRAGSGLILSTPSLMFIYLVQETEDSVGGDREDQKMRMGTGWDLLGGSLSGTFEEGEGQGRGMERNGVILPGWREEDKPGNPEWGGKPLPRIRVCSSSYLIHFAGGRGGTRVRRGGGVLKRRGTEVQSGKQLPIGQERLRTRKSHEEVTWTKILTEFGNNLSLELQEMVFSSAREGGWQECFWTFLPSSHDSTITIFQND